jgi:transcriptional regulator with XRE-family HTH domain
MDEYDAIGPVNALGDELRAYRHKAGWRLEDLAPKLHLSHQMVGAIERGSRAATRKTAELCDEAFETPGTFTRLWKRQAKHAMPSSVSPYYDLEAQATRIHKWELRCIPGLLQIESYARAIMRTGVPRDADEILEENVKLRIGRQHILTCENPPLLWFIVDESVLYRPYGDMDGQLRHMTEMAELPNVVIQVSRYTMNDHPGLNGPLTILEFADSSPIGYAEGWGSGRLIENPANVRTYLAWYDLIRAAALPRDASLDLIKQIGGSQ